MPKFHNASTWKNGVSTHLKQQTVRLLVDLLRDEILSLNKETDSDVHPANYDFYLKNRIGSLIIDMLYQML